MRPLYTSFLSTLTALGALVLMSQVVSNSRFLAHSGEAFYSWSRALPANDPRVYDALVGQVRAKAELYDDLIQKEHLLDGMLVNRSLEGRTIDLCDSLLFSSLRYVGLKKLGFDDRAISAWRAIERSKTGDQWIRHPKCRRSPSRDMLTGVVIALSQKPLGYQEHLHELIDHIGANDGYFADGPLYLSYTTPSLAKLIRLTALASGFSDKDLPKVIREGHSTSELEFYGIKPGFQAHLIALSTWLELELRDDVHLSPETYSANQILAKAVSPFTGVNIGDQALDWDASVLVTLNPENIFFRFLRLKSARALTPASRYLLLKDLMALSQFPHDRLPNDCDRKADYLWQRDWREATLATTVCQYQFSGADFLWMAGLLLEKDRELFLAN